ncbi:MAG TPA: GTPase ObgE [Candidatus Saccharimonadales bacterium]|nr:GTPase ObgE [Candidatus Saccharimonadales bacterium]
MLIDDVTISIKAGKGGDGSAHLKRNAQTAKGGPDGGNGGNGGSVYFVGVDDIAALREFRFKKKLEAESGINGGRQNLYGRNGKDLQIKVPFGTIITEEESGKRYTITRIVPKILLAKGGKGGRGNNEFKNAINQTPKYFERGDPGEEKAVHLELKLIADIGFIGLPNAGKSSLLQELTNARPKIANYPFTTLEPNLGMMGTLILADIPGLIEGASQGKGLGIKFLKHVERTKLLIHCIACDNENVLQIYETVRKELEEYNKEILKKPEIILLTKSDLVDEKEIHKKITLFKNINEKVYSVSIYDYDSIKRVAEILQEYFK